MPSIGIKDIIDILLVASLMFGFYKLLKRSGVTNLFWGIMLLVFLWLLVDGVFRLEMTGALLNSIFSVGMLGLIVIFQEELRGFIYRLGAHLDPTSGLRRFVSKDQTHQDKSTEEIVRACIDMQKSRTGALIVIEGKESLREYADTGEWLDAQISTRLIENIFFKNTPLHDGALIIAKGRLQAAGCILPVSKDVTIPQHYGLRHRAALGLAEKTNVLCIVVSEETGRLSVAQDSTIQEVTPQALTGIVNSFMTKL